MLSENGQNTPEKNKADYIFQFLTEIFNAACCCSAPYSMVCLITKTKNQEHQSQDPHCILYLSEKLKRWVLIKEGKRSGMTSGSDCHWEPQYYLSEITYPPYMLYDFCFCIINYFVAAIYNWDCTALYLER